MNFVLSDTQRMIADTVGTFLTKENSFESRRKRLAGSAPDRMALWENFAEIGVVAAIFPEEAGGLGGTARDVAVVLYEIGRSLAVEPFLATLASSRILLAMKESVSAASEIEAIISGKRVIVLAHGEGFDPFAPPSVSAAPCGGHFKLNGIKPVVRHADSADAFIVTACLPDEPSPSCFLVERSADGVSIDGFRLIDAAGGGTLHLNDAAGSRILTGPGAQEAITDALKWTLIGLGAEVSGILDALNENCRQYLEMRLQFGVPIGKFQALQHRAADMYIAAEETRVIVEALLECQQEAPSAGRAARLSALKLTIDRAGRKVGHEAVQLHGGMGVSDELNISHYMRRLAAIRSEAGGEDLHCERFRSLRASRASAILFDDEPDVAAFRQNVRAFVRDHLPPDLARKTALGLHLGKEDYLQWERILRKRGWFAAAWPEEHGGAGWTLSQQLTFVQEAALNDAPPIMPYGVNMVGPVLYTFGTPDQRAKYLPGILNSETWWCQGYSEPNAGSDLASLKCFAELDGDHYIVNGTKMWTTEAHWADMMHCLVRTGRGGKPQEGITFLLIDMKTPGISIQPILTLDGQHHTNQTFFDNVRVPVDNVVGAEGQGWAIAKFLLGNERVAIADTGAKLRLLEQIKTMYAGAVADARFPGAVKASLGARLAEAEIQLQVLVAVERRYVEAWAAGAARTGPKASLLKIRGTEILQKLTELALELEGPWAAVHDPADLHLDPGTNFGPAQRASFMAHHYLYSRCWSIFGGTNEIQRNIIAKLIGVG